LYVKGVLAMARVKAVMDKYVEKFISRKFLAWGVATYLVSTGSLSSDNWVAVTLTYIGSEALVDLAVRWRHGHNQ
jgi:hypothetical protein